MLQKLEYKRDANYIAGQWVAAEDGRTINVTDPATGEVVGTVPNCGRKEAARAIAAAEAAFPAWRARSAQDRSATLFRLAELIRANQEELAAILTAEQGKPLAEARGEVGMSAAYVQWFAEEARRVYGDVIPSPWGDRRILATKEPV
ncbi:MAG: aldehyde dehydrogenase family protein, partial [Pseudomonadota bacterium]|nr:aldehyde dehydrogenase family protein [Pseudomonadota bacterium]